MVPDFNLVFVSSASIPLTCTVNLSNFAQQFSLHKCLRKALVIVLSMPPSPPLPHLYGWCQGSLVVIKVNWQLKMLNHRAGRAVDGAGPLVDALVLISC